MTDELGKVVARWKAVGLFFLCQPVFLLVTMPGLVLGYPIWHPWIDFSVAEVVVLSVVFAGTTFILPAAFMQVSLYRMAVLFVLLLPWWLVWSYLVIGFAFNQALVLSGLLGVEERFRNSMLLRDAAIAKSG